MTNWKVGGYGLPENYVDAVRRAGGRATLLLPGDDRTPAELLDGVEALLLIGGGDVEPSRYGADTSETIYGVEPDRDALEIDLLVEADRRGTPTLCICRGMQVMNVAFGGSLIQDLPERPAVHAARRPERIGRGRPRRQARGRQRDRPRDRIGRGRVLLPSPPGRGPAGPGVVATGWSEDGLVEAIELERGWMLGVQWHPEDTAPTDEAQQGLFDELVRRARGA